MRHRCAKVFWLPKGATSGFQRKCGSPHLASVSLHPPPWGGLYGTHGLTHCTCPTEKSQDGCVAFVTLTTGSASLAFMLFISQARLKGPLAPGTVPVTEVAGASVGPNGDGGAGCGAQCPRGSAAALFSSQLCGQGLEPGFPHHLTRLRKITCYSHCCLAASVQFSQ